MGQIQYLSGQIKSFNANIFDYADGGDKDFLTNVTRAVAKFYVILRNICAIIMLAGLIFTGIRILLSANIPTKKTQYLMLLQDWLMGMALLIFSHIIMILVFEMCDALTTALSVSMGSGSIKWEIIKQMGGSFDSTTQVIAITLYHWINWLLIVFAIAYFKRFFWTCILVIFAPVMAIMYAFGQQTKQIYSNWLKEFILNAFVQPFHLVVYTVLVTFPMEIANGGSWTWSWNNGTEMIYCLMGMSMIRPAEKYLRRLFQMDKGIANMASYDSGVKEIKNMGKAALTAAKAVAAVYTGGASAMAGKALASGVGKAMSKAGSEAVSNIGGHAAAQLEEASTAEKLSNPGLKENFGADSEGGYYDGDKGRYVSEEELYGGISGPNADQDKDDFSEGDIKALTDGFKQESEKQNATIDATNVTLNAGDAAEESPEWISEAWDKDSQGRYFDPYKEEWFSEQELNEGRDLPKYMEQDKDDFGEGDIKSLADELKQEGGSQGATIDATNVTLNAGSVNLGEGDKNLESETAEIKKLEEKESEAEENDGIELEMSSLSTGEIFKNLGGIEKLGELGVDLFEGIHSMTDGLYIDGDAPTNEWKSDAQWMRGNIKEAGEKRKENMDRQKDNWANNKENISIMSNKYYEEKYLPEMTKKYEGQLKSGKVDMNYVEAQAREKADEKAKKALKDMSEYVPYGITDVNQAYNLYQNANKNGFSPEQSVRNMAGYQKFNSNAGNINSINVDLNGNFQRNDYTSVEAAIPNAKTYYDSGYTNVNEMAWVDYMAEKLGKSPQFAMKVDEELKKKGKGGKLSYNGKDAEMKKVIEQINSHYN